MKQIWNIFRADWKRLTASVVAVVVMLGLCLVPCLYAWFNILSNWDPYGVASTSRIKVAVASEDDGCDVLGLRVNIGQLVLQGLESNDQMGWVFVDDAQTALDGVYAGDYYAALVIPAEFTGDFVSILEGDLRHPQIQYYENEKKNAIAPKITNKAKTAVQEEINTTILEKVADALTTAGSVFKAMGLDGQDIADALLEKLSAAQQDMDQMAQVLASLQQVMDGADSLLAASTITITDARDTMADASDAAGSTVRLIDSGLDAAIGYSRESGIPYGIGLIKNKYIGRTFILPGQASRENKVRIKLNAVTETVSGKRVVMIDDSIVRGTTSARIVKLLREAGAKEVHMRISAPPFLNPCYYGTDIDSRDMLIACHHTVEEIGEILGVDSLGYLSVENVTKLTSDPCKGFCTACFSGNYPTEIPAETGKNRFETKISERKDK